MSRFCIVAMVALLAAQAALAVDYTFTGTAPGTDLWQTPAVWGSAAYPSSFADTAYLSGAVAQTVRTDNGGPYQVGNITMGSGTGTGAILIGNYAGGVGLELGANTTITKNNNTSTDKIYSKLTLDGNTTFNVTKNYLYAYNIEGDVGSVTKDGAGFLVYEGDVGNTYGGLTWLKAGKIILSGPNGTQFIGNGGLKVSGGILQWWAGNHIADTAPIELAGNCELNPNYTTETMGALTLSGGTAVGWSPVGPLGTSEIHFANSSAATWTPGAMLILKPSWNGTLAANTPKYYFGTDSTGLTAQQLSQIRFADDVNGVAANLQGAAFDPAHPGLLIPAPLVVSTFWSADFNHDHVVDFKDYIVLEGNFSKSNATNAMGDADANTIVDFKDYIVLEGQFGKTSTPEPATIGLLVAGGLALLRRKA